LTDIEPSPNAKMGDRRDKFALSHSVDDSNQG